MALSPELALESVAKVNGMAKRMAPRQTSASVARLKACSPSLLIGVRCAFHERDIPLATFLGILKGIELRADLEARERPELGAIRVVVDRHASEGPGLAAREAHSSERRGMILVCPTKEEAIAAIVENQMVVAVLETYDGLPIDSIDIDELKAMIVLVRCLCGAGHKRIGFASSPHLFRRRRDVRRYQAFVASLRDQGVDFRPRWAMNAGSVGHGMHPAEVAAAVAHLIRGEGVTAWVCASDHQAYALMGGLQEMGVRVPSDCSVTGIGCMEPPPGLPRLTSARAPLEHIGSCALTRLVNRIRYPQSTQKRLLVEPQLVAGSTVASWRQD
jgi:LacI family transcriptional regulator